ncbi:hypothetical protein [Marinimicrobium alkaliphilum]|uniref:hypothetical protein n=1 Tax=Marinimicrobium alkaliphilum TaxID=2202654 RepID=UPI000DBA3064|nr:hypothetical protein [Marinimicrobium alkaliphilum]
MILRGSVLWLLVAVAPSALAQPVASHVQVTLGSHRLNQDYRTSDPWENLMDVRSLHTLGYFYQRPADVGWLQYGLEGGGHVGYDSDRELLVVIGGGNSGVSVYSDLWSGDIAGGIFVSATPVTSLRFYAAAGPSLYWGALRRSDRGSGTSVQGTAGDVTVDTRTHRYDLGLGLYRRAGVELIFPNGFALGASVRRLDATLDFRAAGSVRMNQTYTSLTLGGRF